MRAERALADVCPTFTAHQIKSRRRQNGYETVFVPAHDEWSARVEVFRNSDEGIRAVEHQARRAAEFERLVEKFEGGEREDLRSLQPRRCAVLHPVVGGHVDRVNALLRVRPELRSSDMFREEPDFLDEIIAKRADVNPDFPVMVDAAAAARAEGNARGCAPGRARHLRGKSSSTRSWRVASVAATPARPADDESGRASPGGTVARMSEERAYARAR